MCPYNCQLWIRCHVSDEVNSSLQKTYAINDDGSLEWLQQTVTAATVSSVLSPLYWAWKAPSDICEVSSDYFTLANE